MRMLPLSLFLMSCFYRAPIEYINNVTTPVEISCVSCDTSIEFLILRKKELDDSIELIRKQNQFLDSVNWALKIPCDTVKWTPYYYHPKKKKK